MDRRGPEGIVLYESMSDIKRIERDERQQRREARQERAAELQRNPRETDHDDVPPESGHDRRREGEEEEGSPKDDEMWIEQPEALQLIVPDEGVTLSTVSPRTRIQTIIEDDLRLRAGDITLWSRLGDEPYPGRHLVIRRPIEGNWVTFQTAPSFWSIHLLLSTVEGDNYLLNIIM